MFIQNSRRYYEANGQQVSPRAPFLLLMEAKDRPGIYACVRKVALRQWGHWMMGRANLGGRWVTVSGAYGNDGLTMDVDMLPKDAVPLPDDLREAWNKGGGHNSAGAEASAMREWAVRTFCGGKK